MLDIPPMRIPVFVSAPSPDNLSPSQTQSTELIFDFLKRYRMEWRALGRSDYPNETPLREVLRMVKHCSGGVILGFEQFRAKGGTLKYGSGRQETIKTQVLFSTPWNQLEAGLLFSAGLPLLIFKEAGISGGVFDVGSSEIFIHPMPNAATSAKALGQLDAVFQRWVGLVHRHYYGD